MHAAAESDDGTQDYQLSVQDYLTARCAILLITTTEFTVNIGKVTHQQLFVEYGDTRIRAIPMRL
jgi:hypothetical protein